MKKINILQKMEGGRHTGSMGKSIGDKNVSINFVLFISTIVYYLVYPKESSSEQEISRRSVEGRRKHRKEQQRCKHH